MSFLNKFLSPHFTVFLGEKIFTTLSYRNKNKKLQLKDVKKVLVVRPDEIGDMILSSPFFRELRANLPAAWITVVVHPKTYNVLEFCPYVNEVLTFNCELTSDSAHVKNYLKALWLSLRHLLRRRFDLAIYPRMDVDMYYGSYITFLSGAPFRIGYSENASPKKLRYNKGFNHFFSDIIENNSLRHEVEYALDVITRIGGHIENKSLELWLSQADIDFADKLVEELQEKGRYSFLIGFGPGARQDKRMWPISEFIELGRWLISQYNCKIIALGSRGEEILGKELRQDLGDYVTDLIAKSTIRQSAALLKRCNLFIGNDTATMHLAAASRIPAVEISCHPKTGSPSHPNSPLRFKPWGVPSRILQPDSPIPPCSDACYSKDCHCIKGVRIENVKSAAEEMLFPV